MAVVLGVSDAHAAAFLSGSATFDTPSSTPARGASAKAEFTISGAAGARQLTILLTNTDAASGSSAPQYYHEILTGPFFNLGSAPFTPESATDQPGGPVVQTGDCDVAGCAGTTDVGGEWSDATGGAPSSHFRGTAGISTIVLNRFVPYSGTSGTGGIDGDALIEGAVNFVLKVPEGLSEPDINAVYFTYGDRNPHGRTTTTHGHYTTTHGHSSTTGGSTTNGSIPEPATLSLLGLALLGLGYRLRRRSPRD